MQIGQNVVPGCRISFFVKVKLDSFWICQMLFFILVISFLESAYALGFVWSRRQACT